MNKQRLLELADILDRADAEHEARGEPGYDQERYTHNCGTPACALGHWMAANPEFMRRNKPGFIIEKAKLEFDLDYGGADDLFGPVGCNGAKTAKQAADYIRDFVARGGVEL